MFATLRKCIVALVNWFRTLYTTAKIEKGESIMSSLSIQPTYPIFTDSKGEPLENGFIWIGTTNLDPQVNPIGVFWDAALTIPAVQPIRTLAGYPSRNGSPARLYVDSNYSIRVMDKNGGVVYSAPASTERYGNIITAANIEFVQDGLEAVTRTAQSKMRETISTMDFGAKCDWDGISGTDDTAATQKAIDYCLTNGKDLVVPGLSLISSSLNIDRMVDGAAFDNYFTIASISGGGFVVASDTVIFSTNLVNGVDPTLPVTQLVRFSGLKFEADVNTRTAYVLDSNKYLRTLFESCSFRKIKCLNAPAGHLTQSIYFQHCQMRRWIGVFFTSKEISFDLKVFNCLMEAGEVAFDLDFTVGNSFIGSCIEGMSDCAVRFVGGYGLTVQGCYFEENGGAVANGCTLDNSLAVGGLANENILISGNMFAGTAATPTKPQIRWGDSVVATSIGNMCTTTLHYFSTNSRVNVIGDEARTSLANFDPAMRFPAAANQLYGGAITQEFVGGRGGLLKLRSVQNNVISARGVTINEDGRVGMGTDAPATELHIHNTGTSKTRTLMSDATMGSLYGGYVSGYGVAGQGGWAALGTDQNGALAEALVINQSHQVFPAIDNSQTLGTAANRWSVVYAGTGTINTSDERTKQQIKPIDDAALRAWGKVNYCQFKFNDAVKLKGSEARWHFGLVAQRVKEAFESEGLNAFEYGLLCYDEWGNIYKTDDAGKEFLAVKAGNRYGVRYEEALALECAYLRSKLTTK